MASTRVSKRKLAAAIPGSGGIIATISRRTGYSWITCKRHIEDDDELRQLLEDEEASIDDIAEVVLIASIREGNTQDAKWWLARRRRGRFGDNMDVTTGGQPLKGYVTLSPDDWDENGTE